MTAGPESLEVAEMFFSRDWRASAQRVGEAASLCAAADVPAAEVRRVNMFLHPGVPAPSVPC